MTIFTYHIRIFLAIVCWLPLLLSCSREKDSRQSGPGKKDLSTKESIVPEATYASKFSIKNIHGQTIVTVRSPWPGTSREFNYHLYKKGSPSPEVTGTDIAIGVPVASVVCFSTTHLPYLEMLGEENKLIGFPTIDYISSVTFRELAEKGQIRELGPSNDVNLEHIMSLEPEIVMAYSMGNDYAFLEKLSQSGIPVVLIADYMENHPLGRAEWIRVIGLLFDQSVLADSIFRQIENKYMRIRDQVIALTNKPTVFTGIVYGDAWFMPGGRNYAAQFFKDAGANYLWNSNESESNLQLSFEAVYEKAGEADFWIGTATYVSMQDLKSADNRYINFAAFRNNRVYNYSKRIGPSGGNEYFELGYARPDLILSDMVNIFHPGILEENNLYFYEKIE